jgi:hypothetical protein
MSLAKSYYPTESEADEAEAAPAHLMANLRSASRQCQAEGGAVWPSLASILLISCRWSVAERSTMDLSVRSLMIRRGRGSPRAAIAFSTSDGVCISAATSTGLYMRSMASRTRKSSRSSWRERRRSFHWPRPEKGFLWVCTTEPASCADLVRLEGHGGSLRQAYGVGRLVVNHQLMSLTQRAYRTFCGVCG